MDNNEFKLFDEYTEYITRQIRSKKKETEVREEYSSHLMEEYERYTCLGNSHIEAQVHAIESMGDKELIKEQFGKLYPVVPMQYMKSSLNFIIFGLLLSSFHISIFFDEFSQITSFIGSALLLYGLFKLRATDKKLNIAFYYEIAFSIIGLVVGHLGRTLADPTNYILISSFIIVPLDLIGEGFMFAGINSLCKSLDSTMHKRPKMLLAFISRCIFALCILLAMNGAIYLVYFAPIPLIITLWQFHNAKKVLSDANDEFELKTIISVGEKAVYCVLIIILSVTPIISMLAVAGSQPDIEVYNPVDTNYSADEVNNVRMEMVVLGMPEKYVDDLPDSEVMNYKGAMYLHITDGVKCSRSGENLSMSYAYYIFFFPRGEVRTLVRIDIEDESVLRYRNGAYIQHYYTDWNPLSSNSGKENFYLALSNKAGETVKSEIESEYTNSNTVAGFEFKFPKGSVSRRVYVCTQAVCKSYNNDQWLGINGEFIYELNPITAQWQTVNNLAKSIFESNNSLSSTAGHRGSFRLLGMSHSFEYKAEYIGEKAEK